MIAHFFEICYFASLRSEKVQVTLPGIEDVFMLGKVTIEQYAILP